MKTVILLSCALSMLLIVCAVVILVGRGDWMINNYRNLPEERRAQVNILRLRRVMAAMLAFIAVSVPLNLLAVTERQHAILAGVIVVVLLASMIVARVWANFPLFHNPFKK